MNLNFGATEKNKKNVVAEIQLNPILYSIHRYVLNIPRFVFLFAPDTLMRGLVSSLLGFNSILQLQPYEWLPMLVLLVAQVASVFLRELGIVLVILGNAFEL